MVDIRFATSVEYSEEVVLDNTLHLVASLGITPHGIPPEYALFSVGFEDVKDREALLAGVKEALGISDMPKPPDSPPPKPPQKPDPKNYKDDRDGFRAAMRDFQQQAKVFDKKAHKDELKAYQQQARAFTRHQDQLKQQDHALADQALAHVDTIRESHQAFVMDLLKTARERELPSIQEIAGHDDERVSDTQFYSRFARHHQKKVIPPMLEMVEELVQSYEKEAHVAGIRMAAIQKEQQTLLEAQIADLEKTIFESKLRQAGNRADRTKAGITRDDLQQQAHEEATQKAENLLKRNGAYQKLSEEYEKLASRKEGLEQSAFTARESVPSALTLASSLVAWVAKAVVGDQYGDKYRQELLSKGGTDKNLRDNFRANVHQNMQTLRERVEDLPDLFEKAVQGQEQKKAAMLALPADDPRKEKVDAMIALGQEIRETIPLLLSGIEPDPHALLEARGTNITVDIGDEIGISYFREYPKTLIFGEDGTLRNQFRMASMTDDLGQLVVASEDFAYRVPLEIGCNMPLLLNDRLLNQNDPIAKATIAEAMQKDMAVLGQVHMSGYDVDGMTALGMKDEQAIAIGEIAPEKLTEAVADVVRGITYGDVNNPRTFSKEVNPTLGLGEYQAFRVEYGEIADALMPNLAKLWEQAVVPGIEEEIQRRQERKSAIFDTSPKRMAHKAPEKISMMQAVEQGTSRGR